MDRRTFLKAIPVGLAAVVGARASVRPAGTYGELRHWLDAKLRGLPPPIAFDPIRDEGAVRVGSGDKIRDFDRTYTDDFVLGEDQLGLLVSAAQRFTRVQDLVGHGNFNLLSLERSLAFARNFPRVGEFPSAELDFLDEIFHADAQRYGFFGEKVLHKQSAEMAERDVVKIAGSGHYLFRGEPHAKFKRIRRDVGAGIVLTSGVRGIAKQYQLFLDKAVESGGNLSQASRSLAPPGYSFHARGDFDLGKVGFGLGNFDESFCETDEYRKLIDLGYVAIRYTESNPFGVRHEPWHIKIA